MHGKASKIVIASIVTGNDFGHKDSAFTPFPNMLDFGYQANEPSHPSGADMIETIRIGMSNRGHGRSQPSSTASYLRAEIQRTLPSG